MMLRLMSHDLECCNFRRRNFLSVKVFKLDLEGDFKLLFFGGLLCS